MLEVNDKVKIVNKHDRHFGDVGEVIGFKGMLVSVYFGTGDSDLFTYDELRYVPKLRGFELTNDAPEETKLPVRGSNGSAGYDFFAPCDIYCPAMGFSELIPLNIKAYMQKDEVLFLTVRSSLATTKGQLMVSQGTAVIDSDYYNNPLNDGNIGVMFYNRSNKDFLIQEGTRCCQGVFMKYLTADDDVSLGDRKGGYGSTGVK